MRSDNQKVWSFSLGVSLVELLVVVAITALFATIVYPTTQVLQQRDRENRLKKVLKNVQEGGVDNYNTFVVAQINNSNLTSAEKSFAIASGAAMGLVFPLTPSQVENAVGTNLFIPIDATFPAASLTVTVNRRFIRKIPPHPFVGWFPNSHWEFRAATDTSPAGPWFASSSWPTEATGVIEIRSVGAGIALDGTNTDDFHL